MASHTPGPYVQSGTAIYAATPQDVDHRAYRGFDDIEPGAPGYLIAESIPHGPTRKMLTGAPEALAALQTITNCLWAGRDPDKYMIEAARTAIFNSTGA